ncbi:OsmC family protein [Mucilaginibacter sp. SP1R1]|uniref:OsmC family protein n=1 Tax=Mucilaginibacter sp. SP1R1 TaxID=2723091 RepID=UPI0016217DD5|nr:OsmC family protein [Mucilaginibacter sp. SP1R1]MBB6150881.1 organic hydroperoxide reductase OsmC/OhrA [Mucilaginibacter sp. SP1R1]
MKNHHYQTNVTWTGNTGEGTKDYRAYERCHEITIDGKQPIAGSSDPNFRGDGSKHSPEDLLVAAVSSCHMLWYLHLCTTANIVVTAYADNAEGVMLENKSGSGCFTLILLRPVITITDQAMIDRANELHKEANKMCFIANSCNFPILHEPRYQIATAENMAL